MRISNFVTGSAAAALILSLSLDTSAAAATTVTTVTALPATLANLTPAGWQFGAQAGATIAISKDTSQNYNGGASSIVATYPTATGGVYAWGVYDISDLATRDVYIEFWAKMPKAKQGLKFLKIFGVAASNGATANTTFALDYTGGDNGSLYQISFGDGSSPVNDTQNVINLDGSYPSMIGRSYGKATVSTPQKSAFASSSWGTTWHHFKMHVKFNSGTSAATEVNDGAYYLEIDGKVYADASGLFNRHYSDLPIERVELLGWAQGGTAPFEIWYSNVSITTGGFLPAAAAPMPPTMTVTPQ